MILYALEYQTASMKEPWMLKFQSALDRALFHISISPYVIASRLFEVEGAQDECYTKH